ncbi:MAG: MlaD family protein [Fibrobacter sp.]|nr:MlaD family protein [Fibrobacter sp.]
METTRTERIRLGLFLLLCIMGILGFLGYLIGGKLKEQKVMYYSVFDESVQGLSVDARVMLSGIDVGRVKSAQIDSSDMNKVKVWFEVSPETPIKAGTSVQMTSRISLTGSRYLILSGGDISEPNLPAGSEVKVGVNRINEITGQAEVLFGKVEVLVNNLNTVLSADNAEKISRTLENLESASKSGRTMIEHGDAFVQNSNRMISNGSSFVKSLEEPVKNLEKITKSLKTASDEMEQAHLAAEIQKTMIDLQKKLAALDTKQMNDDLVKTIHSIEEMSKGVDLFLYKNQNSFNNSLSQLNEILANLNEFSEKIKNSPSSLIRSEKK